jgi:hypothetical protein
MAFLVSTVSSTVNLYDLGTEVTHPTTDRDLSLEFSAVELAQSTTLTGAISDGTLTLKIIDDEYETYEVDSSEYYAGLSVQNQFVRAEIEEYLTQDELSSGLLDTLIHPAATGLPVTSTAASTKNVYVTSGKFQKWKLAPGDKVVITGGAATGTYTVDTVTDQFQFVVVESIPDSSGVGTLAIYHPIGSTRIAIDTTGLTNVSGSTLQDALTSIDTAISASSGFTANIHKTLRQLIHFIDEGPADGFTSGCTKTTIGFPFVTSEVWRLPDNKKIVELNITRNSSRLPITEEWKMYDVDGTTVVCTVTDTYTYNGVFETSRVRSIA